MKALKTLTMGTAGLVALAGAAAPAHAQYGYGQYGYSPNVIGQVLQSILNPYGQFGYSGYNRVNPQVAVNQCTAAVQQRLSYSYRAGYPYGGYGGYGGYGAYGNGYSNARILGITRVDQRSPTTLRVRGFATSGMNYGRYGYGTYGALGYGYAQPADLSFKCDVDYRGYIRDIDINRRR